MERLRLQSVPVAILPQAGREDFARTYPLVAEFLTANYADAGALTFGVSDGTLYTVLTRNGRRPAGQDSAFPLPCFSPRR